MACCKQIDDEHVQKIRGGRRWLKIIGVTVFMVAFAASVCVLGAPIIAAHHRYEHIVRIHGKEVVQIKIPVITAVFGVYEFINVSKNIGFGYKRHVVKTLVLGGGQNE